MPVAYSNVKAQPTLLLSQQPYLPYGDAALVFGEGSLGKGRMVMSLIASVTRGLPVGLDKTGEAAGDVIVILPEDKPGEQVHERLEAAGADLSRVWDMTRLDSGTRLKFSAKVGTPGDLPALAAFTDRLRRTCMCGFTGTTIGELSGHLAANSGHTGRNPRMVVIDPITAVIGEGTIQTNKGARAFVEPLQDYAEQTGVCVLLVAHPTKAGALQGSGALSDALRLVYFCKWDADNSAHRIMTPVKANNLPPELAGDLRFTVEGTPPRVVWLDRTMMDAGKDDWRAQRAATQAQFSQKVSSLTAQAQAAYGAPIAPSGWCAIRLDHTPGQKDKPVILRDGAASPQDAYWAAESSAGFALPWRPYSGANGKTGSMAQVPLPNGAVVKFAVFMK